MTLLKNEQLKSILNYEGLYSITNYGRVWSYSKQQYGGRTHEGKFLKLGNRDGYKRVCLVKAKKKNYKYVHRLVGEAFLSNPNNKPIINHKDGKRDNNKVTNLEWCTHKENTQHAWRIGLSNASEKQKRVAKENVKLAQLAKRKLVKEDINKIRIAYKNNLCSQTELSKVYNVDASTISNIVNFKTYKEVS